MRTIAVMNQKGGVGKTTTSVNIAAGLARHGRRVLMLDLDPQSHASMHLGIDASGTPSTIYQVFAGARQLGDVLQQAIPNLWVAPADVNLAATEVELADEPGREYILRKAVHDSIAGSDRFDYVIIDCPPSLGILTINALCVATEVFIPLQPHFFALQGLSKLFETTALINRRLNRDLRVSGIILCLYETGTRLASDVTDDLIRFLSASDAQSPWANARIFNSRIRRNIKLAEAPSFGQSIFDYAPASAGAIDYGTLVDEVISLEAAARSSQAA